MSIKSLTLSLLITVIGLMAVSYGSGIYLESKIKPLIRSQLANLGQPEDAISINVQKSLISSEYILTPNIDSLNLEISDTTKEKAAQVKKSLIPLNKTRAKQKIYHIPFNWFLDGSNELYYDQTLISKGTSNVNFNSFKQESVVEDIPSLIGKLSGINNYNIPAKFKFEKIIYSSEIFFSDNSSNFSIYTSPVEYEDLKSSINSKSVKLSFSLNSNIAYDNTNKKIKAFLNITDPLISSNIMSKNVELKDFLLKSKGITFNYNGDTFDRFDSGDFVFESSLNIDELIMGAAKKISQDETDKFSYRFSLNSDMSYDSVAKKMSAFLNLNEPVILLQLPSQNNNRAASLDYMSMESKSITMALDGDTFDKFNSDSFIFNQSTNINGLILEMAGKSIAGNSENGNLVLSINKLISENEINSKQKLLDFNYNFGINGLKTMYNKEAFLSSTKSQFDFAISNLYIDKYDQYSDMALGIRGQDVMQFWGKASAYSPSLVLNIESDIGGKVLDVFGAQAGGAEFKLSSTLNKMESPFSGEAAFRALDADINMVIDPGLENILLMLVSSKPNVDINDFIPKNNANQRTFMFSKKKSELKLNNEFISLQALMAKFSKMMPEASRNQPGVIYQPQPSGSLTEPPAGIKQTDPQGSISQPGSSQSMEQKESDDLQQNQQNQSRQQLPEKNAEVIDEDIPDAYSPEVKQEEPPSVIQQQDNSLQRQVDSPVQSSGDNQEKGLDNNQQPATDQKQQEGVGTNIDEVDEKTEAQSNGNEDQPSSEIKEVIELIDIEVREIEGKLDNIKDSSPDSIEDSGIEIKDLN